MNPFHGGHGIPYYWSQSPITGYGYSNCLLISDYVLGDLIRSIGGQLPKTTPGELFLKELDDSESFEKFKKASQSKAT
jgi:hypothetical protein